MTFQFLNVGFEPYLTFSKFFTLHLWVDFNKFWKCSGISGRDPQKYRVKLFNRFSYLPQPVWFVNWYKTISTIQFFLLFFFSHWDSDNELHLFLCWMINLLLVLVLVSHRLLLLFLFWSSFFDSFITKRLHCNYYLCHSSSRYCLT